MIIACQQQFIKHCFSARCLQFSSIIFNIQPQKQFCTQSLKKNHLLSIDGIPKYDEITGEAVSSAIPLLVKNTEKEFSDFEKVLTEKKTYVWNNVVRKSELIFDKLGLAWSAASHLHRVRNNPSLRMAYQKVCLFIFSPS